MNSVRFLAPAPGTHHAASVHAVDVCASIVVRDSRAGARRVRIPDGFATLPPTAAMTRRF
jgi:hypothetical protein